MDAKLNKIVRKQRIKNAQRSVLMIILREKESKRATWINEQTKIKKWSHDKKQVVRFANRLAKCGLSHCA